MLNLQNVTVKWDMYRQVLKLYKVQMHLQSLSKIICSSVSLMVHILKFFYCVSTFYM